MSRSIRSRRQAAVAATLALALAPLAAACSSGTDAATSKVKPDTANTTIGNLKVQNLTLVTGEEGTGLVALGGAFINDGDKPETLTKVSVEGAPAPAELASSAGTGPITIPAHSAVYLTGGKDRVVVKNATEIAPGTSHKVTLGFSTVGETTLSVTVHTPEDYFKQLKPEAPTSAPATTAAPTTAAPSSSAPAAATTTGSATGQPSGTPNATGSATTTSAATGKASGTPTTNG
ncbi:hypothetical protein [Yinghuangia seranimata]|uniref:hypothetical protein n=1 Tax=Yinghuangia seranimata TaxID=408067 RepID=UPI00248AB8CA|nr:hypothetical protein [Yinghuangia seranimata]MDI2131777.1 hypothetical protein [Yinghuangia seranimata]